MIGTTSRSQKRFPAALQLAAIGALAACSGGGGGGPATAPPVIVTASYVGTGPNPAPGERLVLAFSADVRLIAGALLTDVDFVLSGSATLGDVTAAPALTSNNTVEVTLGAGVVFTPGTTTISLSTDNDAVAGATLPPAGGGDAVVIGASDGTPPVVTDVTVAAVDDELNGSGPAGGVLQVPTNGWTIDLGYADTSGIATAQTVIRASVPVATPQGTQPIGTNLRPFLTETIATNSAASYLVPTTVTFPNGPVTLTCLVVDASGLASSPASFPLTVRAFTAALQPFETTVNPQQVWFLDFSRDLESFTTTAAGGGIAVNVVNVANGRSDFEDLLRVLGLNSATPLLNVDGNGNDSNAVATGRLQGNLLTELAAFYSGANVAFTLTQPSGSFGGNSSVPYAQLGFSRMAIAGAASSPGVLGLAIFDPSNTTQNDDALTDFSGSRLGVFLHTIVDSGMRSSPGTSFRLTFDPFAPSQGGTPIGNDALDGQRLTGSLADARANAIDTALADLARFTATVVAHECGHSVGLVENGPMPTGLYGNDPVNFPVSPAAAADGHIRNDSLFPPGAINVMSPQLSYTTATSPNTTFNTLNLAYLREQVFYNGN